MTSREEVLEEVKKWAADPQKTYADIKFANMLRSRLCEEGLKIEEAHTVVEATYFSIEGVNEDDDYISQLAGEYAVYAARVYTKLKVSLWSPKTATIDAAMLSKFLRGVTVVA